MLDLGVIILNYNTKTITADCLTSIRKSKNRLKYKVLLIDNASTDGSYDFLKRSFPEFEIQRSHTNLGFTKGNNLGIKQLQRKVKYILLLNSDTVVFDHTFDNLVNFGKRAKYEIASCKYLNPDKSFQASGGAYPSFLNVFIWLSGLDDIFAKVFAISSYQQRSEKYFQGDKQVGWVGGACMLVKGSVFKKIGGLDENIFMYGEDVEFCVRAKKNGYRVGWTDATSIIHIGGASFKNASEKQWLGEFKGLIYIYKKHFGLFSALIVRLLIYFFVILRITVFTIIGKRERANTYAKIITKI